jgi:hypothetical protein
LGDGKVDKIAPILYMALALYWITVSFPTYRKDGNLKNLLRDIGIVVVIGFCLGIFKCGAEKR